MSRLQIMTWLVQTTGSLHLHPSHLTSSAVNNVNSDEPRVNSGEIIAKNNYSDIEDITAVTSKTAAIKTDTESPPSTPTPWDHLQPHHNASTQSTQRSWWQSSSNFWQFNCTSIIIYMQRVQIQFSKHNNSNGRNKTTTISIRMSQHGQGQET